MEGTEQARLRGLHRGLTPAQFKDRVPESTYVDYADAIERQRTSGGAILTNSPAERYQPTSGSSSKIKWVPYTAGFLAELDAAISPFASELYRIAPGARGGRHYWSLSFLPTHLRESTDANVNDDAALLSWSKRFYSTMASPVPSWVAYTKTADDSIFATLCFLAACEDLSLISVWSPTFALNLLEKLAEYRTDIIDVLDHGSFGDRSADFNGEAPRSLRGAQLLRAWDGTLDPAFFAELWPSLSLVSAWDTSTSKRWADRLAERLPHARFSGKGLWATEGVLTVPYRDKMPIAVTSHFYEFVDLSTGTVRCAWELEQGQEVRPLLTTSSGLLRYALADRLVVRGTLHRTPCLSFLGRLSDVDMVGEKTSPEAAARALDAIATDQARPLSLLALAPQQEADKPRYVALREGRPSTRDDDASSARLEAALRESFHYALARDLDQLDPALVLTIPDARALYERTCVARGMVAGNIKVEPLMYCGTPASASLIAGRIESHPIRGVERWT